MTKTDLSALSYPDYLLSEHWQAKRQMMLSFYPHCAMCRSKKQLHIHHNSYRSLGAETHFDLIVLCSDCHAKFHDVESSETLTTKARSIVPNNKDQSEPFDYLDKLKKENAEKKRRIEKTKEEERKKELIKTSKRHYRAFEYYLDRAKRNFLRGEVITDNNPIFIEARYLECLTEHRQPRQKNIYMQKILRALFENGSKNEDEIVVLVSEKDRGKEASSSKIKNLIIILDKMFNKDLATATYDHIKGEMKIKIKSEKLRRSIPLNIIDYVYMFLLNNNNDSYVSDVYNKIQLLITEGDRFGLTIHPAQEGWAAYEKNMFYRHHLLDQEVSSITTISPSTLLRFINEYHPHGKYETLPPFFASPRPLGIN